MNKPENPPAFPCTEKRYDGIHTIDYNRSGLSMLDYFAAKALQSVAVDLMNTGSMPNEIAAAAYGLAEAMMSERQKRL